MLYGTRYLGDPEQDMEPLSVECRIHGVWFHMPLIRVQGDDAVVEVFNGTERHLKLVRRRELRFYENAAAIEDAV